MAKRTIRRPPGYDGRFKFRSRNGDEATVLTVEDAVDLMSVESDGLEDVRPIDCRYFNAAGTCVYQYAVTAEQEEIVAHADHPTWNVHDFLAAVVGNRYVEVYSDGKEASVVRMS